MTDRTHPDSGRIITSSDILLHDAKTALMYEELRAAIDDGHESMTHSDALAEIAAIRAENVELRTGYAAARLEIESLQARIKTMAEERSDELMAAHLDGGMRAAQPAGAQQPGVVYAALSDAEIDRIVPALESVSEDFPAEWAVWKDRERIRKELRASHGQAQAAPQPSPASQGDALDAAQRTNHAD